MPASGIGALIAVTQQKSQQATSADSSQPVFNDPLVLIGKSLDALHREVDGLSRKIDALHQLLTRPGQKSSGVF